MNVYIEEEYFDLIGDFFEREKHYFDSKITNNIKVLLAMFSALKINTTLKNNEVVKYAKEMAGSKNYTSFKDVIISRCLKNQTLRTVKEITEINDFNGFYFTLNPLNNTFNVIAKDAKFTFNNFYQNCNKNGYQFNGDIKQLANFASPTNAMIIVDPYLFDNPFQEKINLLVEFIELYKSNLGGIKFELTILTIGTNQNNFATAFSRLSNLDNIAVEIIKFDRLGHDREIYTNFSYLNIGLPFIRVNTNFNQNFLAHDTDSTQIKINYYQFQEKLKQIKKKVDSQPNQIGLLKYRWSNCIFNNRLFDLID